MRRGSQAIVAVSVSAALFFPGNSAHAEDANPRPGEPSSASPADSASPPSNPNQVRTANGAVPEQAVPEQAATERAAQAAYETALSLYDNGDIEGALVAMRKSFELSSRPELLYNLARLEREGQRCQASLADYRRYLERVPQGRYRQAAQHAIEELTGECPAAELEKSPTSKTDPVALEAAAHQPAPAPSPAAPYWTTPHLVAWSAISAGVLCATSALYFRLAAQNARDDAEQSVQREAMGGARWDQARQDDQHRDLSFAWGFAGTAGALVAGGVLTLIFSHPPRASDQPNAFISVGPGAVAASYRASF